MCGIIFIRVRAIVEAKRSTSFLKKLILVIFPMKQDLTFHANCIQWRQFARNLKSCFLRKKKIISLSSSEFAHRVVKAKGIFFSYFSLFSFTFCFEINEELFCVDISCD